LSLVRREVAMSPADDGSDEPFTVVTVSHFCGWSVGFGLVSCKKTLFSVGFGFLTGLTV